jgi:hypothetical protein
MKCLRGEVGAIKSVASSSLFERLDADLGGTRNRVRLGLARTIHIYVCTVYTRYFKQ